MHVFQRHLVSEAEFLALPESMSKVELVDGEVVVAPAPTLKHQEVLRRIVVELSTWAARAPRPVTILQSPVDIRFGPERILQPDAAVVLEKLSFDERGPLLRIPELCIEVISRDRLYDRVTKRFLYAAAGVAEYWVVEPAGPIERWTGPNLEQAEVVVAKLESSLLEGFSVEVAQIFAGLTGGR